MNVEQTASVDYAPAGPRITYEITLINQGNIPLTGLVVTDVLPAQAKLLYFADGEGGTWLSRQTNTEAGRVALWRSETPLAPGSSTRLTYMVEVLWQDAGSGKLEKQMPAVRAAGWDETVPQSTVEVTLAAPTPTSPSTTVSLASPQSTSILLPSPTASPTRGASVIPTVPASPTTQPSTSEPLVKPLAATQAPQPSTSAAGGMSPVVLVVPIVVVIAIVSWLVLKKR